MPPIQFQCLRFNAKDKLVESFVDQANALQTEILFSRERIPEGNVLLFVDDPLQYNVEKEGPLYRLSLANASGIATLAKITEIEYLLISVAIGILYANVVAKNPLFNREDCFHEVSPACVLSHAGAMATLGEMMQSLYLCPNCLRFFASLDAAEEVNALHRILDAVEDQRINRSCRRIRIQNRK